MLRSLLLTRTRRPLARAIPIVLVAFVAAFVTFAGDAQDAPAAPEPAVQVQAAVDLPSPDGPAADPVPGADDPGSTAPTPGGDDPGAGGDDPGTDPGADPGEPTDPGDDGSAEPAPGGDDPGPGGELPGPDPGTDPDPGTEPPACDPDADDACVPACDPAAESFDEGCEEQPTPIDPGNGGIGSSGAGSGDDPAGAGGDSGVAGSGFGGGDDLDGGVLGRPGARSPASAGSGVAGGGRGGGNAINGGLIRLRADGSASGSGRGGPGAGGALGAADAGLAGAGAGSTASLAGDDLAAALADADAADRSGAAADGAAIEAEGNADDGDERGSDGPLPRPVQQIVEVVPEPIKALLVALVALAVLLGGGYLFMSARNRRLQRQRAELLQEVGLLQTALLPPVPTTVGSAATTVAYRPSEGPGAGGDFYDALSLGGGRAAFILGDVCGHGREALERTAFIRYTLRAYLEAGMAPRMALQVAGRVIDQHMGGNFATVVLAIHDPLDGTLTYACAGHPAPIVVGTTRPEPILAASSPPVGLGMRTGVRQTTVPLPAGSVACLYTDGLAEARTEDGGVLGRPRLADLLDGLGRDATATALLDAVAADSSEVSDDMATVLISPNEGVVAGGFRSEQLELDVDEAEAGLGERFLKACDVDPKRTAEVGEEARAIAHAYGGAVLHVRFGSAEGQLRVEVTPPADELIEAGNPSA